MSCIPVLKIPLASKERANPPQQKNVASRLQSRPTLEQRSGPPCYLSIRSEVPRGQDSLKIWKLSNRTNDAQSEVIHTYILKRSHGQYWMNMHLILSCRQSILHATQPKQKKTIYIYIYIFPIINPKKSLENKQQTTKLSETTSKACHTWLFHQRNQCSFQILFVLPGLDIHRFPTPWVGRRLGYPSSNQPIYM